MPQVQVSRTIKTSGSANRQMGKSTKAWYTTVLPTEQSTMPYITKDKPPSTYCSMSGTLYRLTDYTTVHIGQCRIYIMQRECVFLKTLVFSLTNRRHTAKLKSRIATCRVG